MFKQNFHWAVLKELNFFVHILLIQIFKSVTEAETKDGFFLPHWKNYKNNI